MTYPQLNSTLLKNPSKFWFILLLFHSLLSNAQLPNFTLAVTNTSETCPGNATINFYAQGTDSAAAVSYSIYQLPNTTNPISVLSTNFLGGLTHGDYRITATQTLGSDSNMQTYDVNIENNLILLAFTITSTKVSCNNNGTMTANVFSGTGIQYEIIAGPVTQPPQTSPTFTNLPAGVYQVRVIDNCGEGWVATHTLQSEDLAVSVTLGSTEEQLATCNEITITNTITPPSSSTLSYPVTVVYTVNPPGGGAPVVTTSTITSGNLATLTISTVIPYFSNEVYSYTLTITDACGKVYTSANTQINKTLLFNVLKIPAKCGEYSLKYVVNNYLPPLTMNFTTSPPGFNPALYNTNHPGPFAGPNILYGDFNNAVPFGTYTAQVTDACGKSTTVTITLDAIPADPNITMTPNPGCDSGKSKVEILITGFTIVTAIITEAPAAFSTNLPVDVSGLITTPPGNLTLIDMPSGNYKITLVDECGNTYIKEFIVAPTTTSVSVGTRSGCELGTGSVRIRGNNTDLISVEIISAPAAYTQPLPYDVSFNITLTGIFSMNGFPTGNYTFKLTDSCGIIHNQTVFIDGYATTTNTYNVTEHCGSFDLTFSHISNGNVMEAFYLQKFDPLTGFWGHPQTGTTYIDGTPPSNTNSYPIINTIMNYNISYLGTFRIIRRFETFENGSIGEFKTCVEVVREFTFTNEIRISDIQKTTCSGTVTDVRVTAAGIPPLTYQITTKNGLPFFVNNGNNPVFPNLAPAVYNFLVFDTCGNISNRLTDVAALPSLAQSTQPGNLVLCDEIDNDGQTVFNLASQNATILGSQLPSDYMITYHTSMADAANAINPLPDLYTSASRTIYCRLQYKTNASCYDITTFNIIVNPYPQLQMEKLAVLCAGNQVTLVADTGYDSYLWSNGATTRIITVDEAGNYTVTVYKTANGITCSATYSIEVKLSASPSIQQIITTDFTTDENTISVVLNNPSLGNYSYSLDNVHFQNSANFYGLEAGEYTVYVKDENGCMPINQNVFLLSYPNFFTPNGDGYHDYWQIIFGELEPNMKIYIFDRYGKLLKQLDPRGQGWNGIYNGKQLPSADYWFLVIRENGKEYRGHFTMKR